MTGASLQSNPIVTPAEAGVQDFLSWTGPLPSEGYEVYNFTTFERFGALAP